MKENVISAKVTLKETLCDFLKAMRVCKTTIPSSTTYHFPYSVRAMTGLLLHSWLSNYSHKQFYTDMDRIYLENSPQPFDNSFSEKDMLSQDCLVQIIDANPETLDVYYVGQHLMFCGFEHAFNGKQATLYDTRLEVLRKKNPLVLKMEKEQIKVNVLIYKDSINRLLDIVKEEDPAVFATAASNLEQYGHLF